MQDTSHLASLQQQTRRRIIKAWLPFSLLAMLLGCYCSYKWFSMMLNEYHQLEQDTSMLLLGIFGVCIIMAIIAWQLYLRRNLIYNRYLYDSDYFNAYKHALATRIHPIIGAQTHYAPEVGITAEEFANSGFPLFSQPVNYYSAGKISGEIGRTTFQFAEVLADQHSSHNGASQHTPLFHGTFFTVDLHKRMSAKTIVLPDSLKYFAPLLVGKSSEEDSFKQESFQRIALEDIEFEKYFEAYGTDQTESRYILSPALMARMVAFRKESKKAIQFSFKDGKAYFAIYYRWRKQRLRPPVFSSLHHDKRAEQYVADVALMLNIIKEINFNSTLSR